MEFQNVSRLLLDIENGYSSSQPQSTGQVHKKVKPNPSLKDPWQRGSVASSVAQPRTPRYHLMYNSEIAPIYGTGCLPGGLSGETHPHLYFAWKKTRKTPSSLPDRSE
ncbi:hypothetical protein AVEN_235485-1 [Araneus ventricosus]|uniref:Uncharacterized protein n=1 Tax=Araneus ventricosus TaxID=182803 RepID=A0A4Y2A446_ARAVE|nr:hypothetical protein AVEN_235485-1 [Araneus ventricosus]